MKSLRNSAPPIKYLQKIEKEYYLLAFHYIIFYISLTFRIKSLENREIAV